MTAAFERNFEEQLEAARMLMEAPGRRIHVLGVSVSGDDIMMARSVSEGTTRGEARGIVQALEREIARIRKLIGDVA